jgi:general secretion pathway protein H
MTLVEMLVVLAIIGVMGGLTVLGMGNAARGANAESEARRLADRLQLAADEAMVSDRAVALTWDATGYGFLAEGERGWQPSDGDAFARHALPRGLRLSLPEHRPYPLGLESGAAPFVARVAGGGAGWTIRYDGLLVTAAPVPRA